MASDPVIVAKRRKNLPGLWAVVEAFLKKYKGQIHTNWGALFSVRTKVKEGGVEVDFCERDLLLRFERLRLPDGVSFTTNRRHFKSPYSRKIGRPAAHLGWEVQSREQADAEAIRAFLAAPPNVDDLRRLELAKNDAISIDPDAVYLVLAPPDFSRLDRALDTLRSLARRHAHGKPALPAKPLGPRLTGRRPSAAQLEKWPNWRHCLDEEDEEGQDESTIRPDDEQSVIGPETTCTAFAASSADGRRFPLFALAPGAEDLRQGNLDEVVLLERGGKRTILMFPNAWQSQLEGSTIDREDRRLPIRAKSVLSLPGGRRLELTLERHGRVTWTGSSDDKTASR